jgi:Linalool dehydratase/isomerase
MYSSTGDGFLHRVDGRINVHPPVVANAIKEIIAKEGGQHDSPTIIARAREMTANAELSKKPYLSPTFGYIAQWLSEVAGPPDLDALLRHADTYLNPSWSKGGLYYARCDTGWDREGNYTCVEPYTGECGDRIRSAQCERWAEEDVGSAVDERGCREQTLDRWSRARAGC